MTVVLDCNIIVMSLTSRSAYHRIYRALVNGDFKIAVSSEIMLEYEEVIERKYNIRTARAFVSLLRELPNVLHTTVYFNWKLIEGDTDDNKYVDCAIAAQAEYIVTQDKHFHVLKQIAFPKVQTISIDTFLGKCANTNW
ncbi:putative toxin-antitoxin system toxin component, PIN family [Parapedobacter sp. 10938]|uniref:putative toxin-antitoxin system toxin component, PIN family n=1 Tax=Parapedobacter flavus TaxID=3110225 RepID=UPI002DB7FCDC|nr:putative toxin-antitoxin system toxin component, PIN family [Parapedobacter sp. 10938]MEC3878749.1 putative toxin-antitoxin system toxin component, PIN family [Parapedobacter sp. 10938]